MSDLDDASLSDEVMADAIDDDDEELLESLGLQLIQSVLCRQPIPVVEDLLLAGAPIWYQDDQEGMSALHAAAYVENEQILELLLENGALWNAVDNLGNTAADVALSLNNEPCYTLIRDAGIRAELLLALLAAQSTTPSPSDIVLKLTGSTAAESTEAFLSSHLRFTQDPAGQEVCMLDLGDGDEVGVMMGWECGIMQETVKRLCANHINTSQGLRILNIGFGLGIIDSLFQSYSPALHVIVEPHRDVLDRMRIHGWHLKPGVKILAGKWQEYVGTELLQPSDGGFDVVYTDTFAEDYNALRTFFGYLPTLLKGPESRFSFFNGLGATNPLFYDVYTHLAELHLAQVGMHVEWSDVDVGEEGDGDRWQGSRQYFKLPLYRLPVGMLS